MSFMARTLVFCGLRVLAALPRDGQLSRSILHTTDAGIQGQLHLYTLEESVLGQGAYSSPETQPQGVSRSVDSASVITQPLHVGSPISAR